MVFCCFGEKPDVSIVFLVFLVFLVWGGIGRGIDLESVPDQKYQKYQKNQKNYWFFVVFVIFLVFSWFFWYFWFLRSGGVSSGQPAQGCWSVAAQRQL